MNCQVARVRLSAFQDGELDPRLSKEIERHLECCAPCLAEWQALQRLVGRLGRLTAVQPPADFSTRVMAGLRTRPGTRMRLIPSLAYTLALLAIFTGGFLLGISANGQSPSPLRPAMTYSAVLSESRGLGLLNVQDSTLALFGGDAHEN
jgi:anti-sigma factor RsiW